MRIQQGCLVARGHKAGPFRSERTKPAAGAFGNCRKSARHDSNSRVIWGIPVYSKLGA
jgi:hypothetical protein